MKGIEQVSSYVGLAEPLRSAKALLNDNDLQMQAISVGKGHYIDSLKKYLRAVEGDSTNLDTLDQLGQDMINKLDVSLLGLNPFVIAKQPISYLGAATVMDEKYLKAGLIAGKEVTLENIRENRNFIAPS